MSGNREVTQEEYDEYRALQKVMDEFTDMDLSDAKVLARKLHENNHRVTGTEAERISSLLLAMERKVRYAKKVLS